MQEPQSVVHFAHIEACGLLWRRTAVLPVARLRRLRRGYATLVEELKLRKRKSGERLAMSDSLRVRIHSDERVALGKLAESLDEKPSRIVRRLIREAITEGPDFFDDGVDELRAAHRQLAAIGRNINQLARSANQGEKIMPVQLKRNLAAAKQQVERVADIYRDAVERARQRTVRRLESS